MTLNKHLLAAGLLLSALAAAPASQPATQPAAAPAPASAGSLELRAATAFNKGQYVLALPLLQKLQAEYAQQPDKLGPVQEKIRVCEAQIRQATQASGAAPPAPPSAAGERKPHKPPQPGEVRSLQIKDLGNFEYDADKGGNIPADVRALNGASVKVSGFMIPIDQAENITQFALVSSLFECCFGQPPQVQHTVVCKAPAGKAVGYFPDELVVEGKLKVQEKKDDGFIVSVFELDVSSVKPATK
ncbi:MAG TPA: DUF3299 domain-containing protein [Tepidisphaeraceae bacterium]|nr:DUF3299 domain-containing protein [Tepidisphaeraceae bacterium]